MKIVKIENWKIINGNDFLPPEQAIMSLCGNVYGHHSFIDGKFVVTSPIYSSCGRYVCTTNTMYYLGEVDPDYFKWIKANNLNWDESEPVKMKNKNCFSTQFNL